MRNSRPCYQDYWHTDLRSYAVTGFNDPRLLKAPQKGMSFLLQSGLNLFLMALVGSLVFAECIAHLDW